MILAQTSDYLSFGATMLFAVGLPCLGLLFSVVAMQKQGINRKCALSTLTFFAALLIACVTWTISNKGTTTPEAEIGIMLGVAAIHSLSAILAIMGVAEMRTRPRWSRGLKRGIWGFWMNSAMLFVIALWFYAHVSKKFHDGIFK